MDQQMFLKTTSIKPPIRDAIAKASEREDQGLPIIDFGSGNVGKLPFNQKLFTKMDLEINENLPEGLQGIAEVIKQGILQSFYPHPRALAYSPTGGTNIVKTHVIRYFKEVHGVPLHKKDTEKVIATAGGQQAMAAALRAIKEGTKVFLSQWEYEPVPNIIEENKCKAVRIAIDKDLSINKDDLREKVVEESVFYLSMPNNPTGYVSPHDLESIIQLMREKRGGVIWDAPYIFTILKLYPTKAEFNQKYLGEKIREFKKISRKYYENMCILSSISKTCLMAGLRFGFATASVQWIALMNSLIGRENLSSPTPSFIMGTQALQFFLQKPITHEWMCNIVARRLTQLIEEGLPLIIPENGAFGALYVLIKTKGIDGAKIANKLRDKYGITAINGNPFYGKPIDAIRLSLAATPWTENDQEWERNVKALKNALKQ